jgi:hypothetical protein
MYETRACVNEFMGLLRSSDQAGNPSWEDLSGKTRTCFLRQEFRQIRLASRMQTILREEPKFPIRQIIVGSFGAA